MKTERKNIWKSLSVLAFALILGVLVSGKPAEVYAADTQTDNLVAEINVADEVKMAKASSNNVIIFNPDYPLDTQTYTVGTTLDLQFILACYGNSYESFYIEIYNEANERVAYTYDSFPSEANYYTYKLPWTTKVSPGKYTIKCYSTTTGLGDSVEVTLTEVEGEHFTCEETGTQTALIDNVKKPQTAWMATNATYETWSKSIDYQLKLVEMYVGTTADCIVYDENYYNESATADSQWFLMKFYLKNNGKELLTPSDVINTLDFYTQKGASAQVLDTASFSGERNGMGVYDLKLYEGADGYFWLGVLLPKSVGYPNIQISNGLDRDNYKYTYCWLSIDPTEGRSVYKNIADTKITLSDTAYIYDGKAKKPTVTVKDGSTKLKKGTHYTVSYKNNKKVGDATVTIKGKGKYAGTVTQTFTIGAKKGTSFTVGNYKYKVTGAGEVAFVGLKKNIAKVKVADTITYKKATYKITSIADTALKGKTKVTSVTVGENVKKIGKEAFSGCKKLKTITIKSTNLKSVGKNALKGINSKATIKVPKAKLTSYKKILKSKGQGKKVTIKKA